MATYGLTANLTQLAAVVHAQLEHDLLHRGEAVVRARIRGVGRGERDTAAEPKPERGIEVRLVPQLAARAAEARFLAVSSGVAAVQAVPRPEVDADALEPAFAGIGGDAEIHCRPRGDSAAVLPDAAEHVLIQEVDRTGQRDRAGIGILRFLRERGGARHHHHTDHCDDCESAASYSKRHEHRLPPLSPRVEKRGGAPSAPPARNTVCRPTPPMPA